MERAGRFALVLHALGLIAHRASSTPPLIAYAHFGIAAFLATIAVPLAFDAQVTSAFWAAEGAAVVWYGVRTRRTIAQATGLLMQVAAGIALFLGWHALHRGLPVANDAVLGAALVVGAALFSTRILQRIAGTTPVPPTLPLGWAAVWWFTTGFAEISRCAPWALQPSYHLLFVAASVVAVDGLSMRWRWPQLRAASLLLTAAAALAAVVTIGRIGHPFAGFMAFALPLALVLHHILLAADEKRGAPSFQSVRHVGGWWLLLASLVLETSWQAERHAEPPHFWAFVAVVAVLAASIALVAGGAKRGLWPFAVAEAHYVPLGIFPALAGLVVLLPLGNATLSGADGLGWPYLPLLNVFDATQVAATASLLLLAGVLKPEEGRLLRGVLIALAFIWLSARRAHRPPLGRRAVRGRAAATVDALPRAAHAVVDWHRHCHPGPRLAPWLTHGVVRRHHAALRRGRQAPAFRRRRARYPDLGGNIDRRRAARPRRRLFRPAATGRAGATRGEGE